MDAWFIFLRFVQLTQAIMFTTESSDQEACAQLLYDLIEDAEQNLAYKDFNERYE